MSSFDPAISYLPLNREHRFKTNLCIEPGEIYAFDFDGVISSNFEDQLYRVESTPTDVELTAATAERLGVRCDGLEDRYQRHLVYQAAMWRLGRPISRGPRFIQAKQAGDVAQLFVLTARSGWFAVERCRDFLTANGISPVETFHVGRVDKSLQINLLCREFPHKTIHFIEDSLKHLEQVMGSHPGNVYPILVPGEEEERFSDDYLMRHYIDTLEDVALLIQG